MYFFLTMTQYFFQANRIQVSGLEPSEFHTTSMPSVASIDDSVFTTSRTTSSIIMPSMLVTQIKVRPNVTPNSKPHNLPTRQSSSRITLLFVAITIILVLSWLPYWLTIFAETYVGLISRHLVYFNNCTNFLVFAMNPTLRHEMAQVIKRLRCCQIGRP